MGENEGDDDNNNNQQSRGNRDLSNIENRDWDKAKASVVLVNKTMNIHVDTRCGPIRRKTYCIRNKIIFFQQKIVFSLFLMLWRMLSAECEPIHCHQDNF